MSLPGVECGRAAPEPLVSLVGKLDPLVPLYLLIDPFAGEPFAPLDEVAREADGLEALMAARSAFWKREVFRVPLEARISLHVSKHPYLVALLGTDDLWCAQSVRIASSERAQALESGAAPYRIGGWLQSSAAPEALAEQIGRLCTLRVAAGIVTKARYLRLADRRALALICHVVDKSPVSERMPALRRWLWLDDSGRIETLEATREPLHQHGDPDDRLVLGREAWQRIVQGTSIHSVRARLIAAKPGALADFARIESALTRARAFAARWPARFVDDLDLQAWTLLNLCAGDVEDNEAVLSVLRNGDPNFPETDDDPPEPFHLLVDAARAAAEPVSAPIESKRLEYDV